MFLHQLVSEDAYLGEGSWEKRLLHGETTVEGTAGVRVSGTEWTPASFHSVGLEQSTNSFWASISMSGDHRQHACFSCLESWNGGTDGDPGVQWGSLMVSMKSAEEIQLTDLVNDHNDMLIFIQLSLRAELFLSCCIIRGYSSHTLWCEFSFLGFW